MFDPLLLRVCDRSYSLSSCLSLPSAVLTGVSYHVGIWGLPLNCLSRAVTNNILYPSSCILHGLKFLRGRYNSHSWTKMPTLLIRKNYTGGHGDNRLQNDLQTSPTLLLQIRLAFLNHTPNLRDEKSLLSKPLTAKRRTRECLICGQGRRCVRPRPHQSIKLSSV